MVAGGMQKVLGNDSQAKIRGGAVSPLLYPSLLYKLHPGATIDSRPGGFSSSHLLPSHPLEKEADPDKSGTGAGQIGLKRNRELTVDWLTPCYFW